jgi:hypothetical protein
MYIKFVALYCNVVSSLVPKTYYSVTHFMMQSLSSLFCVHTVPIIYFAFTDPERSVNTVTAIGQTISAARTDTSVTQLSLQ